MNELISVIVPVYNVEKFLPRCIESIINQTYKKIEIILIDDGSTDSCLKICKKYKSIDPRVVVYEKNNGGLSSARNEGIKHSKGKFIIYIDSDDFVTSMYVENLYHAISSTESDIAISSFYLANEAGKVIEKKKSESLEVITLSLDEALRQLLLQKKFDNNAWGKIYKRDFFTIFKYPEGKLFEDLPITYQLFLNSEKIAYINAFDYFYVQRNDSILNMDFNPNKLDLLNFVEEMFNNLSKEKPELINYVGTRAFSSLMSLWRTIPRKNQYNAYVWKHAIRYRRYPLKIKDSKLKLKLGSLLTFFGIDISYTLMSKSK